jgi:hypothetical protein
MNYDGGPERGYVPRMPQGYPPGPRQIPSGYPAHALPGNSARYCYPNQQPHMGYNHPQARGYVYPQQQRPVCNDYYPGDNNGQRHYSPAYQANQQCYPQQGNQAYYQQQGYPQQQQYPPQQQHQYQSNSSLANPNIRPQGFQQPHPGAPMPVDNSQYNSMVYDQQQQQQQQHLQQQQIYPCHPAQYPQQQGCPAPVQQNNMIHSNSNQRKPYGPGLPVRTGFRNPGPPPNFHRPPSLSRPVMPPPQLQQQQQQRPTQHQQQYVQQQQKQQLQRPHLQQQFQTHQQFTVTTQAPQIPQTQQEQQSWMTANQQQPAIVPTMESQPVIVSSSSVSTSAVQTSTTVVTPQVPMNPQISTNSQKNFVPSVVSNKVIVPWGWGRNVVSDFVIYRR